MDTLIKDMVSLQHCSVSLLVSWLTQFEANQGLLIAFMTTLEISNLHDLWVIDGGESNIEVF